MAKRKSADAEAGLTPVEADVQIIEAQDKELAPYLNGQPYNEERIIQEVEFFHNMHMNSAFEVGRRLLVLKATIPHGQFRATVLERVQIDGPHASRLMAFARTVVEISAISKGALDFDKLKTMDHRKVEALKAIAEADPEELEATGKIGGRTLDEWDAKSRKELTAIVREQQDKLEMRREQLTAANEKLLAQKEKTEAIISATPNAVSMALTRLGNHMRDALTDFSNTAHSTEELSEATVYDLAIMKAQLRNFYHRLNDIIDERFPEVNEVPTDIDLGEFPVIDNEPKPAKKSARVVDAK